MEEADGAATDSHKNWNGRFGDINVFVVLLEHSERLGIWECLQEAVETGRPIERPVRNCSCGEERRVLKSANALLCLKTNGFTLKIVASAFPILVYFDNLLLLPYWSTKAFHVAIEENARENNSSICIRRGPSEIWVIQKC